MATLRSCALALVAAALTGLPLAALADGPRINDQFPPKGHLSPPAVGAVDGCSKHVEVGGFIPKATVKLYRNMALAGTQTPKFGFTTFSVPALTLGDKLAATQTVNGETSAPTNPATTVGAAPTSLNAPTIDHVIYACGRIVPVHGLVSGVTVDVRDVEASSSIGSGFTPNDWGNDWTPAFTSPLVAGHHVTATQTACAVTSASSAPVAVLPEPMPIATPSLDPPVLGNDAVTAHGLYTGALLEVFDNAVADGSGYATGATNWQGLTAPVGAGSMISARQSLCHHGPVSKPQPPVKKLPAPIVLAPICPKDHRAVVRGTTINANVVLFRNGAIVGYGGAGPGDVTIWFAPPNLAATGDKITAVQYIGSIVSPVSNAVTVNCFKQNVVTQHNDNARQGAQLAETALTPASVGGPGFGLLYERAVLGTMLAQPLYVHGVKTASGLKNLVFVATAQDVVYAFDADDTSPDTVGPNGDSSKAIWRTVLGTPHHGDICDETNPAVVGVTSTPVIDVSAGRIYVVARDDKNGSDGLGNDYLHALDITTGTDVVPAVKVSASFGSGDQVQRFNAACQRQRPGLLLLNGNVYLGYGTYSCDDSSRCNGPLYRGWVIGYHGTDLTPAGAFSVALTPAEGMMGIWASGNGLAGSADGSIFLETGNDPNTGSGGPVLANADSFVKLKAGTSSLSFAARFQPSTAKTLQVGDTDLGAGGPMLLPGGKVIGGGKDGSFFVLPQSDLQTGTTSFQAFYNTFHVGPTPYPYNTPIAWPTQCPPGASVFGVAYQDQPCSVPPSWYINGESFGPNIHAGPVYWQTDATHGMIYKMPEKDYLKAFAYDVSTGTVNPTPAFVATVRPAHDGMPGGFSSVSANGTSNGIVWTVVQQLNSMMGPPTPALLYAFDATNLHVIWHNDATAVPFAKFNAPTIADGRVFLPSFNLFQVYGLVPKGMKKMIAPNEPVSAIAYRWRHLGGAQGMLGRAAEKVTRDDAAGSHMDFTSAIAGGGYGIVSVPVGTRILRPMCDESKHPNAMTTVVSSIYASPRTGAHYVRGEIRRVYLAQGGVKRFGYPLTDEIAAPDGFGLETRFERGTIRWHANKGAVVVQSGREGSQPAR
ncbi:MAG TPA: hypothetical protein VK665_18600 [Candidatus Elarobacter sp.]|nr:hypothetical protein [Candidatus Elarobacter sp.]